ncbi:MAG: glycosyltransferase family 2 protein [Pseudomonadales bacterium]|nr:glycosyltransferase family 2 protein [Pseudomonadales bacterium]
MDVSVIIVNWNTRQLLYDCLKSIKDTTKNITYEIIVVDNNSSDDSVEMLAEKFPDVKLIVNGKNLGFAAANNQGIEISQGRYVLLLNSDTILYEGAIEKNVIYADDNPDAAVFGCRVMNSPDNVDMTCFAFPTLLNLFFSVTGLEQAFKMSRLFGRERMRWWPRDTFRRVDVVTGMYMFVRKKAIDEVGMMDDSFFFYYEETDWCYRFAKAGWKALFNPEAIIMHVGGGGQSSSKAAMKMFVQQQKSCLIYYKKHKGQIKTFIARILLALGFAGRSLYWSSLIMFKKLIAAQTHHQIRNNMKSLAAVKYLLFGIEP